MPKVVVDLFEKELVDYFGGDCDAIAVNSGTSALIAALWACDLNGGEVITTPYTFTATVNAIVIAGGVPVFVDIKEHDCLIDENKIADACTGDTVAIVPVHLFGSVCNMPVINDVAAKYGATVIEDAAQAFGALSPAGYKAGTLADAGCFSFYKTKSFSTFEGGAIIIPKPGLPSKWSLDAERVRRITRDGTKSAADDADNSERYTLEEIGFNFRMSEPCALVGLERLKLHRPSVGAELGRYGPQDGYYPRVVYDQPIYKKLYGNGWAGSCPVAEEMARRVREGKAC